MRSKLVAGALAGLALLAVAGCGDDDSSESTPGSVDQGQSAPPAASDPDGTAPDGTVPDAAPGTGTTEPPATGDVPTRIISLSPTHTETLFAIGAGDQVIAVDPFSNYPEEAAAKATELSGYEPNVEAIAGYEPDLVVTDGTNPDLLTQLDALGIPHWEGPAAITFSDVYDQIEQLGAATGHLGAAAELVAQMEADIAELTADLPELPEPLTYYHELDPSYFSVTSDTFIGYVYSQLGLRSIADLAEGNGGAYPQLNAEFIISADPDLIFQACTKYCGETAETMAARPGWDAITAVVNGDVIELDDDIASRWGPRIVDHLRQVRDAVAEVAARQPAG